VDELDWQWYLERLITAAAMAPDLATFVAELTLDPPASTSDLAGPPHLDDDFLVLSTVHSAKGLEWPIVHVMHLVDGSFPSDMALTSNAGLVEVSRRGAAFVADALVTVIVSMVTQPKPIEELQGLVYGMANESEALNQEESAWYRKPSVLAVGALGLVVVLSLFFV